MKYPTVEPNSLTHRAKLESPHLPLRLLSSRWTSWKAMRFLYTGQQLTWGQTTWEIDVQLKYRWDCECLLCSSCSVSTRVQTDNPCGLTVTERWPLFCRWRRGSSQPVCGKARWIEPLAPQDFWWLQHESPDKIQYIHTAEWTEETVWTKTWNVQ